MGQYSVIVKPCPLQGNDSFLDGGVWGSQWGNDQKRKFLLIDNIFMYEVHWYVDLYKKEALILSLDRSKGEAWSIPIKWYWPV